MPRSTEDIKRDLAKAQARWNGVYSKVKRYVTELARLDKRKKSLVKSLKEARKREKDINNRYAPLPKQV